MRIFGIRTDPEIISSHPAYPGARYSADSVRGVSFRRLVPSAPSLGSGAARSEGHAQEQPRRLGGGETGVGVVRRSSRQVFEPAQREEHAVLEHREEAADLAGIVVERAVSRLIVELGVELDAEVALVAWGLFELARATPDRGDASAELLAVGVAEKVVVDARAKVVGPFDPRQDVAKEDEIDAVVGVKAERADGGGLTALQILGLDAVRRLQRSGAARRPGVVGVRVTARPTETELQIELVVDRPQLGL